MRFKSSRHDPVVHDTLKAALEAPSLYDEFLLHLARRGFSIAQKITERDWSEPYRKNEAVVGGHSRDLRTPSQTLGYL